MASKKVVMFSLAPMLFDARIQREAKALRNEGYSVEIVYIEDQWMLKGVPNVAEAQRIYNADMDGIKSSPIFLWSRYWRFLPKPVHHLLQFIELLVKILFKVLFTRADFYQSHDLKPAIFAALGSWLYNGKLVYDAHELEVTTGGKRFEKLFFKYERFICNRASIITTVNEQIAQIMERNYKVKVGIIANRPVFVNYEDIQKDALKKELKLSDSDKVLMYVGYVTKHIRGIEIVIRALEKIDDNIKLFIMGVGRLNEFKLHLQEYAAEYKVQNVMSRVQFIGPFPPDEIINYLHGADLSMLLYQQNTENSVSNAPNKFYQSIMARTPILASNNQTFPKYIHQNGVGPIGDVVKENDIDAVADKITELLDDKKQLIFRENANILADKVSWEAEANKLVSFFNAN